MTVDAVPAPQRGRVLAALSNTWLATETGRRLEQLVDQRETFTVSGLRASARALLLSMLARRIDLPAVWVTPGSEDAERLVEDANLYLQGTAYRVLLFPERERSRFDEGANDPERLTVLQAMAWGEPVVAVAPVGALLQKTLSRDEVAQQVLELAVGREVDLDTILAGLVERGYEPMPMVEHRGQFSRRGGILDVYPSTGRPVRIEFFGDTIDAMRVFDIDTQRSVEPVDTLALLPVRETEQESYLTSFLPPQAHVVLEEPSRLRLRLQEMVADFGVAAGAVGTAAGVDWETIEEALGERPRVELTSWGAEESGSDLHIPTDPAPAFAARMEAFSRQVTDRAKEGEVVVVVSHHATRLCEILRWEEDSRLAGSADEILVEDGLESERLHLRPGRVYVEPGYLSEGFFLARGLGPALTVLTDRELLGLTRKRRYARPVDRGSALTLGDLKPGDYVVHVTHGVGLYEGLVTLEIQGSSRDFLKIRYHDGAQVYVATDQMNLVTKYVGADAGAPALARLGKAEWQKTRQKVSQEVKDMAEKLLGLYAERKGREGHAFEPDTPWQMELEAAFPYDETPDQDKAIDQVKRDMEAQEPMDRLICGDVGYGKTEIAVRAAFKAVMGGRQVGLLVPTTILAEQHHETFRERMGPFPVKVEALSRFRTAKEQQAVVEGVRDGTVDVVIGTHRLLQKDIRFKNLGLLIVDEEQHFGVEHKEQLKERFPLVDVLTLSATPIPRTMQMSLVGVRDLSLIETPPEARLPVRTYLFEHHPEVVRGAIMRELEREGQVFFVHNKVRGIEKIAHEVRELVPGARVAVGHGQMSEERLERIIAEFLQGRHDILVCTTIIESGLDMPNVNTIVVNNAHMFGLGQLYQLRGRVGRSSRQAWCYLLYPPGKMLTHEAEMRLETVRDFTALGSGYQVALRDLEIRGAGSLLGAQQSGHIATVGFHLYVQMLEEAVEEVKSGARPRSRTEAPVLEIPVEAYLPDGYVSDARHKLTLYRRLAEMTSADELEAMGEELRDRFGPLPDPVVNLLEFVRLKLLALDMGVPSVKFRGTPYGDRSIACLLPFVGELKPRDLDRIEEISGLRASFSNHVLVLEGLRTGENWLASTLTALKWVHQHRSPKPRA